MKGTTFIAIGTGTVAGIAIGLFLGGYFGQHSSPTDATVTERIDTLVMRDTISVVRERLVPTLAREGPTYTFSPEECDTAASAGDSLRIIGETKVYTDTLYRAVVSGIRPSLDSLTIYTPRTIVTHTLAPRTSRWGVGIMAGMSVTPRGISPAVGIGFTYRLWP